MSKLSRGVLWVLDATDEKSPPFVASGNWDLCWKYEDVLAGIRLLLEGEETPQYIGSPPEHGGSVQAMIECALMEDAPIYLPRPMPLTWAQELLSVDEWLARKEGEKVVVGWDISWIGETLLCFSCLLPGTYWWRQYLPKGKSGQDLLPSFLVHQAKQPETAAIICHPNGEVVVVAKSDRIFSSPDNDVPDALTITTRVSGRKIVDLQLVRDGLVFLPKRDVVLVVDSASYAGNLCADWKRIQPAPA